MSAREARDVRLHDPEADRRMAGAASTWRYLPSILWYPLRGYALFIVVIMGGLLYVFTLGGLLAIAAIGVMLGWLGQYLFCVVQETALGHATPPALDTGIYAQPQYGRMLMVIGYGLAFFQLAHFISQAQGHQAAIAVAAAGVLLFPAFVVLLALEDNALSALNPLKLGGFIFHTGGAYVFACLVLAGAFGLAWVLVGHIADVLAYLLVIYCIIMACHLLGFTAHRRHDRLNIAVMVARPSDESRGLQAQREELQALLRRVDKLLAMNNADAARHLLLVEQKDLVNPRLFHEELFEALTARRQDALSLVQGEQLLRQLVQAKRFDRALDIHERCLDIAVNFEPRPAAECVQLAEAAFQARRFALFERIITGFTARHPGTPETVTLRFLQARQLQEIKHDDAGALAILRPLLHAQSHPLHARITALYTALSRLSS